MHRSIQLLLCALLFATSASAQLRPFDPATPVAGHLIVHGGGGVSAGTRARFFSLAGGVKARIVVVPTASRYADEDDAEDRYLEPWRSFGAAELELVHVRDRDPAALEAAGRRIANATGVWLSGGAQDRLVDAYRQSPVDKAMHELLARGGVIGGTSAGAACMSLVMIAGGNPEPELATGFGFLHGLVVDQHFGQRNRLPRLRNALRRSPGKFGLGLDERTAVEVHGRLIRVHGEGHVTIPLAADDETPIVLRAGNAIDLPRLRRAAGQRAEPVEMDEFRVPAGSFVLAGYEPDAACLGAFVERAGGAAAKILVLTVASRDPARDASALTAAFAEFDIASCEVRHVESRNEAMIEASVEQIAAATGVWFAGDQPWRVVDCYSEPATVAALRAVLGRGGVVGAPGATASALCSCLVRGDPLDDRTLFAPGYDRGLALLAGFAFESRSDGKGYEDPLTDLVSPDRALYALSAGPGCAAVIDGAVLRVVGEGSVHVAAWTDRPTGPQRAICEPGTAFDYVKWETR